MAEKVTLQVELQSKLEQTKGAITQLKEKGGFKDNSKAEQQIQSLIQELDSLAKITNPSLKNLSRIDALFNQLSEILLKVAHATSNTSKEFQELEKKLKKQQEAEEKLRKERSGILKKGRVNKDTGQYELFTKYQDEVIAQSGIKNKKGQAIKTAGTFLKKFDENGNPIEGAFQNPEEAKKIYDSLKRTQQENETRLKELNQKLAEYKTLIEKTNTELAVQSEKEESPLAGQIIQNKVDVNRRVEEEKEQIHTAQDMKEATNAVEGFTKATDRQSSSLGRAFKQFTIYNIAVRAAKTAVREAVQTVKELDKSLTEQAMVTGLTRQQTYKLVGEYQNLALQCGATTKEIAGVATEYMKQGKTIQESLTLTQAAVKAAKVARVSVGDSVNYLTTALNGFQLSAEDAMKVSDKFAAVAASSATDYDELAIALSKVASQANLAGMSIDYTTALLTKGLETTREAPETMGTALKTIIARMRELSDYGETLEGDTDINNVESQLAYVGIALRDTNGELRSTEDVLDELGKKWDTLNKNQQAALAKALAGTRQQSRLIALMDDYERVTELQEISQRSAGATAAQAGVYLEGIEASMNKIQVAWEKIIMSISDSEFIIEIFSFIGDTLDTIGDHLSTDWGLISTLTLASTLGVKILGNKMQEMGVAKALATEARLKEIREKKALLIEKKASIAAKEQVLLAKKEGKQEKFNLNIEKIKTKLKEGEISDEQAQLLMTQAEADLKKDDIAIQTEIDNLKTEEMALEQELYSLGAKGYGNWTGIASTVAATGGGLMSLITGSTTWLGIMTAISLLFKAIPPVMSLISVATKKQNMEELKGIPLLIAKMYAKAAETLGPIAGPIAATAILAGITALAGIGIAASMGAFKKEEDKSAAEEINNLSNEIYKLNEKANAINNITTSFDKLDNKLIKTKKDLEEMNSLLDQGSELMDDSEVKKNKDIGFGKGKNEKDWYDQASDEEKRLYLSRKQEDIQSQLSSKRNKQIDLIKKMSASERKKLLNDKSTNAKIIEAQSAIYALNNNELYKNINLLKERNSLSDEAAKATESLTQSLLEGLSAEEAWSFTEHPEKIAELTSKISELKMEATDANGKIKQFSTAEVLDSESFSLKERVKAYKELKNTIDQIGNADLKNSFKTEYSGFDMFSRMSDDVLGFIDTVGLSVDEVDDLWSAWEVLQKNGVEISKERWEENFDKYLEVLAQTGGDVTEATKQVYGDLLDEEGKTLNAFASAYGDLVEVGILNMGQNIQKLQNSINGFYEKALSWGEMSESERAEFIQDNAEIFNDGTLLKAFESGNYQDIEFALQNNKALRDQIKKRKEEVEQELLVEEARSGADRNEAYIAELKRYQAYLNDAENMFKASLKIRLEQEQKQLDEYRSLMEEEQEALEDSLNKRKDAYEKYFDAISQEEEDEEYEEQADLLISNLSKLGSTSNANAQQQTKELEQKLEELEEERLKELRERAQEAVIQNIDDELAEISDKFDKLLESNQALLAAMTGSLEDPAKFVTNMISKEIGNGQTALGMEEYIENLKTTYGSVLGDKIDWEVLKEEIHQLFMNVNGQEITLNEEEQQTIYTAVTSAMTQIGKR